jgi:O-acetylhomoserine/O-acetylserine sulfhydrylase-like pyridoxal-dependent enzyme
LIHAGEDVAPAAPLITPIYETTTFVFDSAADVERYQAGRARSILLALRQPTVVAAERKLAALDRAEMALAFSSGMAATATVDRARQCRRRSRLRVGDLRRQALVTDLLTRFGVSVRFASLDELADPRVIGERTRLVWFGRRSIRRSGASTSGASPRRACRRA